MESVAAVEDEVDFDESREEELEIENKEGGFVVNEPEEEFEKVTQSSGVEEAAAQELLYTGVEDEAVVEDEMHERKEDKYASRVEGDEEEIDEEVINEQEPDLVVKDKCNGFKVVFDDSDCVLERVASADSIDSNSSIHSAASETSHKLEAIMLDRIAAIDQIRNLLETELENGKIMCVQFSFNFCFVWSSDDTSPY